VAVFLDGTIPRGGLGEIDLRRWRSLTDADRDDVAADVAARTGAILEAMPPGRAHFLHRGVRYAFVPASGEVTVGYDGARFRPSPDQEDSHRADMAALGADTSIHDEVQMYTARVPARCGPGGFDRAAARGGRATPSGWSTTRIRTPTS